MSENLIDEHIFLEHFGPAIDGEYIITEITKYGLQLKRWKAMTEIQDTHVGNHLLPGDYFKNKEGILFQVCSNILGLSEGVKLISAKNMLNGHYTTILPEDVVSREEVGGE